MSSIVIDDTTQAGLSPRLMRAQLGEIMTARFWCVIIAALAAPLGLRAASDQPVLVRPYYVSPRSPQQHASLSGGWQLAGRDQPIVTLDELPDSAKWMPVTVPDSVQWSLYASGQLPHPYYHLNSKKYAWVPDKVWYYRRQFELPASANGKYVFLCFDGVGYYSRFWLNGVLLGEHQGMFGGPAVEISRMVRGSGPNELIVEVRAPSYGHQDWGGKALETVIVPWGIGGGIDSVTAPSGIGPKEFLPFGLWRDVRLEFVPRAHLERPFLVTTQANSREARLQLSAEVMVNSHSLEYRLSSAQDSFTSRRAPGLELQVQLADKSGSGPVLTRTFPLDVYEGRNFTKAEIRVPSPKLWWPNGMGVPNLYRVHVSLLREGRAIDHLEFDFGIRTIRQVPSAGPRTQDRWANWQFIVNGRPLFLKGANWAWPMDVLLHLPRERYAWQLEAARASGIRILRVWGGGNPETDEFFSLCDELGLMVWEDFPIANAETPGWNQAAWEAQTLQTIFRLRNHPSLAVWCGGNEFNAYSTGNTATIGIVERSVADFDHTRLFLRTSPDAGDIHPYPDMDPTWFGQIYKLAPFVSEFGIFAICEPEAVREVVDRRELDGPLRGIFSKEFTASHPEFVHHFLQYEFDATQKLLWARMSQVDDISAPTLDALSDASRVAVGEFFQIASDAFQANYPVTTGMMPWSFTIPWPIFFPAAMDAFDQSTSMYYFLKRTYEPTHVIVRLPHLLWAKEEKLPISASVMHGPDTALPASGLSVEVLNERFERIWKQERSITLKPGPSVTNVDLGDFSIDGSLADRFFFVIAELRRPDGVLISRSVYWPRCLKRMEDAEFRKTYRSSPQASLFFEKGPWLRRQVSSSPTTLEISVVERRDVDEHQSRLKVRVRNAGLRPAFLTHIDIKDCRRAFYGDDNFFWLPPGEVRTLNFRVRWLDARARDRARLTVRAWNADERQASLRGGAESSN
jgi:beta-mannosidase